MENLENQDPLEAKPIKSSNKKKVLFESETTVLDENTGEMLSTKKVTKMVLPQEPPFVKLYITDMMKILNVNETCKNVLLAFLPSMGYNNIIAAQKYTKEHVCNALNLSMDSVNKAINTMSQEGILIRKARGIYLVNPQIIAKGKWEDIQEIRLKVSYSADGTKTISHENVKRIDPQYHLL